MPLLRLLLPARYPVAVPKGELPSPDREWLSHFFGVLRSREEVYSPVELASRGSPDVECLQVPRPRAVSRKKPLRRGRLRFIALLGLDRAAYFANYIITLFDDCG